MGWSQEARTSFCVPTSWIPEAKLEYCYSGLEPGGQDLILFANFRELELRDAEAGEPQTEEGQPGARMEAAPLQAAKKRED